MISEKTISTWLSEFNRKSDDDDGNGMILLEKQINIHSKMIMAEPKFVALLATIMNIVKFDNSVSAAIYALSIYHDCQRRQFESDKLNKDLKPFKV